VRRASSPCCAESDISADATGGNWSPGATFDAIAQRVQGLGGDLTITPSSPTGTRKHPRPPRGPGAERVSFSGKAGLIYDRIGDFEGFLLEGDRMATAEEALADAGHFDTLSNGLSIQIRLPGFNFSTGLGKLSYVP
jgi:hypothetical protein